MADTAYDVEVVMDGVIVSQGEFETHLAFDLSELLALEPGNRSEVKNQYSAYRLLANRDLISFCFPHSGDWKEAWLKREYLEAFFKNWEALTT